MSWGVQPGRRQGQRCGGENSDTEVTKIARRSQTAKRALPRPCATRQVLRPVRTAQGRKITTGPAASVPEPLEDAASNIGAGSSGQSPARVVIRSDKPCGCDRAVGESDQRLPAGQRSAAYRYVPKVSAVRL